MGSCGSGQALAYGLHPACVTFKPYNSKNTSGEIENYNWKSIYCCDLQLKVLRITATLQCVMCNPGFPYEGRIYIPGDFNIFFMEGLVELLK